MNAETVTSVIDAVASKLAVPTEYILSMLIRQGKFNITFAFVGSVVFLILFILFLKFIKKYKQTGDGEELVIITALCSIAVFIFFLIFFIHSVNWLIDPEAYAFKELINMFKGGGR